MKTVLVFCFLFFLISFHVEGEPHPRIVSLSPPITEELYLLGLGENVVANTVYCTRPEDAKNKEKVGSVLNVNIERIIRLKPELVFASPLMDRRLIKKLERLGIDVHIFPHPRNFDEICQRFLKLAEILEKKDVAFEIVSSFKKRYKMIGDRSPSNKRRPQVFVQLGASPLFTATKDSILNSFVEDAGGENIAKDAKTGLFSKEELILKDPEYILIVSMGIQGEKEKQRWLKSKELKAVKQGNVYLIDSHRFCSPTVKTYIEGVEELREILSGRGKNEKM